jgi:hypothetical protein
MQIGAIYTNNMPRKTAPISVALASNFVCQVSERYQPRAFVATRADLAFVCEAPEQINSYYQAPRIEISPEITFREQYFFAASLPPQAKLQAAVESSSRRTETRVVERLFQRLFSRRIRIPQFYGPAQSAANVDNSSSKREPSAAAAQTIRVERLLPRVFAEQSRGAERPSSKTALSPAHESEWGTPITTHEAARPVTLGAPEIQRVTRQVIREMDHQVRARRERTGKSPR